MTTFNWLFSQEKQSCMILIDPILGNSWMPEQIKIRRPKFLAWENFLWPYKQWTWYSGSKKLVGVSWNINFLWIFVNLKSKWYQVFSAKFTKKKLLIVHSRFCPPKRFSGLSEIWEKNKRTVFLSTYFFILRQHDKNVNYIFLMKSKKKQTENVHRSNSNILWCLTKERLNADGANKMVGLWIVGQWIIIS